MRTQHYFMPALAVAVLLMGPSCSKTPAQSKFATPDDAAKALLQALKAENMEQIAAIFGRKTVEAVASGDTVSDKRIARSSVLRWSSPGAGRHSAPIARN